MNKLVTFLIILSIFSCSNLDKKDCSHLDWHKQGKADGEQGRRRSYYLQHSTFCLQTPDRSAYLKGRKEGLHLFCTKKSGFKEGLSGAIYLHQCDDNEKEEFMKGYQRGQRIYRDQEDIKELQGKIKEKENKISFESQDEEEREELREEVRLMKKELKIEKKFLQKLKKQAHQKKLW